MKVGVQLKFSCFTNVSATSLYLWFERGVREEIHIHIKNPFLNRGGGTWHYTLLFTILHIYERRICGYECGWSTMWIFEARATQTDETSWMSGETTSRQSHLHKKESLSFVSIFENTTVHKLMSRFFFMLSSIMADNNCQKSLKKLTRWFLLLTVHRNWGELTSFYWSYFLCMGDVTLTQSRCYMQSMIPTHVTLLSWVKLILMYLN